MHEVKVFDGFGNLKKVISISSLIQRSQLQIDQPLVFGKSKGFVRFKKNTANNQKNSITYKF